MNFFTSYFTDVIRYRYAKFSGRARRSEFWFFILFKWLILISIFIGTFIITRKIDDPTTLMNEAATICKVLYLALFIPSLAVSVRRLHDTGNSAWFLLLRLIPVLGSLVLLIFYIQDSQPLTNQYGKNPHVLPDELNSLSEHLILEA